MKNKNWDIRSNIKHFLLSLLWTIFKVFIEFVTVLLSVLCFGLLAARHVGS